MLFNSLNFAVFLPVIFVFYWFVTQRSLKLQNILLLVSSYFFYACWDWRFLFLLIFSTFLDYYTGHKIFKSSGESQKKFWLWLSIIINLGFLGVFKYYNFFANSFAEMTSNLGFHVNPWTLKVILPVGISFYTFHGLSYVIDIYKNRLKPVKSIIDYSVFVGFFPLLVAGPIERATHLLPQIQKKRSFDYAQATDGMRQILWGLFKKIVIADGCAEYANMVFDNFSVHSGSTLFLGALCFTVQIYCDFSGYSDIGLGTAKLFGIELLRNFAFPYFSRDIAEFWRRWHISLSGWFRDYLYIPLGGSEKGTWLKIRNTFIIFLVSGFWHGANWTFIAWGFLNALYIMPSIILNTNRRNMDTVTLGRLVPGLKDLFSICFTFFLTIIAWIFFRSNEIKQAFQYLSRMLSSSIFSLPKVSESTIMVLRLSIIFFIIEWIGREGQFALSHFSKVPQPIRWLFYFILIVFMFAFQGKAQTFIYFQF